jgi:2-methylcitrate dehydratase PrpD
MLQGGSVSNARPDWLDQWARFASHVRLEDLPGAVVERSKQVLFDCVGAIAAEPRTMRAARFSRPFTRVTTLARDAATIPAFRDPARVRFRMRDGRVLAADALTNKGDTEDPDSAEEIVAKFHEVTEPVWDRRQREAMLIAVDGIDGAVGIEALNDVLAV